MVRWATFGAAGLLTVVTGFLVWAEVADGAAPGPRAFVWGVAMLLWFAGIALSCSLLIIRRVTKRIDCWGKKLVRAYGLQRLESLAELLDETNVTPMYGRK